MAAAGVGCWAVTALVIRQARKLKLVDRPGARKVHTSAVPRLGGVAVMAVTVCVLGGWMLAGRGVLDSPTTSRLTALLGAALVMGLIGLSDDLANLRARYKLLGQFALAVVAVRMGVSLDLAAILGASGPLIRVAGFVLSVVWLVGVTNSLNLIDGLDGLAGGIAAIALGLTAAICLATGQAAAAVVSLVVLGCVGGFLAHNIRPARIFLGDSGSLFLGFLLGGLVLVLANKAGPAPLAALPVVALGLPILDTASAMLRRVLERRPIFAPDRRHVHHCLLARGFSHGQTVAILHGVSLLAVLVGCGLFLVNGPAGWAMLGAAWAVLIGLMSYAGPLHPRQLYHGFGRRQSFMNAARRDSKTFREIQLRLREAPDLRSWWQVMRRAARYFGFVRLRINIEGPASQMHSHRLRWSNAALAEGDDLISMKLSSAPLHSGHRYSVLIELPADGSFELATRKASLFGRMLDEHTPDFLTAAEARKRRTEGLALTNKRSVSPAQPSRPRPLAKQP